MTFPRTGSLVVFAWLATFSPAMADDAPLPSILAGGLRQGVTLERYLQQVMAPFRQAAGKEQTLTQAMIDAQARRLDDQRRAMAMAQFAELDSDRNGVVTRAEMTEGAVKPGGRAVGRMAQMLLSADSDGDGNVTLAEAYAKPATARQTGDIAPRQDNPAAGLLALGDGKSVSARQVLEKALSTFRSIDRDGDSVLSREEVTSSAARIGRSAKDLAAEGLGGQSAACAFPRPSDKAQTVLVGAYEGDALADVYVGSSGKETTSSNIVVQPGEAPLYIVVASYEQQIWSVSGAVGRVERFVVAAPAGGASSGVVGLGADRVTFGDPLGRRCMNYFYKSGTNETAAARRAFAMATGKDADRVGGAYTTSSVNVPDMVFTRLPRAPYPPEGFDAQIWESAIRFTPRGLARFDPASVVSAMPAKRYEVLPQEIGLAQLQHSGHLDRRGGVFRIVRAIPHFPAGLNGAHAVTFSLARDVPLPSGSPGHSCVLSEETGEAVLPGPMCRMPKTKRAVDPDSTFK